MIRNLSDDVPSYRLVVAAVATNEPRKKLSTGAAENDEEHFVIRGAMSAIA
jgi:hypothetical protein